MKILIDIGHPGHVHFYKNFIWEMQQRGHEVKVTSREKDVTSALLNHYKIEYTILSTQKGGFFHLSQEILKRWWELLKIIKEFQPDIITDIGGAFIALPSKLQDIPSVVFTDTEHVFIDKYITFPFSKIVLTPACFKNKLGDKQIKYNGFHEMAYLHPKYFQPNPDILNQLGVDEDQSYFILRFVSWDASHDINQSGFSMDWKIKIIRKLEKFGKVLISSEKSLPAALSDYAIHIPPHQIHDALYYADLFMGDGATMATESGLLGTPAIYCSSLVGTMGNFIELMDKYEIVFSYKSPGEALKKALEILKTDQYKTIWREKKKKIFEDKIDVTAYMINFFEKEFNDRLNIR
jgi:predicted glycosyltransferase